MLNSRYVLSCLMWFVVAVAAVAQESPEYLNDREIKRAVERGGTAIMESGDATQNDVLREQLQREQASLAVPPAKELTRGGEDIYERAADGVLVVAGIFLCGRCDNYHANCASGFVISEDGLAITNHHVIQKEDNLTLVAMTRDGRVVPVLEVLASNKRDDVALIRLGEGDYHALPIAREAKVSEPVHTITHPDGRFYVYTSGEIARFYLQQRKDGPPVRRIQITAAYAKGSSGGPILNDLGQVVGVVTTTDSVYYNEKDGKQLNLQMVFYDCVSYESILDLFADDPK